jgi:predicted permease
MANLWQDIRHGVRVLTSSPAFTLVAILSLALGIGANTAIFTLANAVFLQPLPLRDVQSLVSLYTIDEKIPGLLPVAYPNFEDYRKSQTVFSDMVALTPVTVGIAGALGQPVQESAELVPGRFFDFAGVQASLGRALTPADDGAPGSSPVVVLSHGCWRRNFGADPSIIGRTIRVNREPYTVVGVMPEGFKSFNTLTQPALWAPMCMYTRLLQRPEIMTERRALFFYVFGRLKPGVSLAQATASLEPITQQLSHTHPVNRGRSLRLIPTAEASINPMMQATFRHATFLMFGVVAFVLLIACANVASLLLVRARKRSKEFAIRLALGAGAWQITRQMLVESTMLSLAGGLAGLVVARWTRDALWAMRPPMFTALSLDLSLSPRVLLFTLLLSLLTGILFGLAPALNAWRRDLASDLKERTSQVVRDRGLWNLRGLLVAGQCALSVIALICAGLFLESLRRVQQTDPGFEVSRLALLRLNFGAENYRKDQIVTFLRQAQERVQSIPAVRAAAFSSVHPLSGSAFLRGMAKEGEDPAARPAMVMMNAIGPRFFETTAVRLLEGREFTDADHEGAPQVVIVNAALARNLWGAESPIGKRIRFGGDKEFRQIVGVAADTRLLNLHEPPRPIVYIPLMQEPAPAATLLVQTTGDPSAVFGAVRAEIQRLDSNLPLPPLFTMPEQVIRSLWSQRLIAALLAVFGLLGLLLAAIGVYGLTSYAVSQRVSEIGIRMALGATSRDVMQLIIGQSLRLVVPGLALGVITAFALARLVSALLSGVTTWHPPAYLGATILLMAVALVACWIPSRRATRIQPVLALRQE